MRTRGEDVKKYLGLDMGFHYQGGGRVMEEYTEIQRKPHELRKQYSVYIDEMGDDGEPDTDA